MVTITMGSMTPQNERPEQSAEMAATTGLVRMAKEQGLALTGPNGLLKQLTKDVIETDTRDEPPRSVAHLPGWQPRCAGGN